MILHFVETLIQEVKLVPLFIWIIYFTVLINIIIINTISLSNWIIVAFNGLINSSRPPFRFIPHKNNLFLLSFIHSFIHSFISLSIFLVTVKIFVRLAVDFWFYKQDTRLSKPLFSLLLLRIIITFSLSSCLKYVLSQPQK